MIDWLLRETQEPTIRVGDCDLPLAIRRHARATRMTLRLAPDGSEVRLTIPQWGRTAEAVEFARSRTAWLAEQLGRIPESTPPAPGGTLIYRGMPVRIEWTPGAPRKPQMDPDAIRLGGPEDGLARRLLRWLESEALRLMAQDAAFYCREAGCETPPIRLSRARRRWGSCASDGTIRLNWRLVQAPDFVRRSVVAHEVAHLTHFDHSPAFHALLARIFEGDLDTANLWLKREGRALYSSFG
ncbi:M48 family peptidase [Altericroceibacterium spongiae]|uniref:M48 family peptidase n=1 Tax=Altericroceibacterium spongiae TaxID=2320269 RepID=A0A420EJ86_9SPHN|nr:SprT family zinc-dependent metalloprotease [Altericroceibacterium spongiae]RKF20782.1 M48 family peptidase [Altericroceibacterium spongiae]